MTHTAYPAEDVRERPLQRAAPHEPQRRTPARVRLSWGTVSMNPGMAKEMKIIQFPVNIDKFTGFFDKFLKVNGERINEIIKYISAVYNHRLKQKMNIFSSFAE